MKFKDFLQERIYSKDDKVIITIQHSREASTDEAISTFMKRVPYETHFKGAGDSVIYSILNYVSSTESSKLLSSIKGKGPYSVDQKQYDFFLEQVIESCTKLMSVAKPDVIIYPQSSSKLVGDFAKHLSLKFPNAHLLSDVFVKKILKAEDIEPLINTAHPDWKKFVETHPHEVEKLRRSLLKQIEDHGALELKKLYKPYLKFIKNFIEMKDAYQVLETVLDKRVLVIDDVLSSGSTMIEMLRQLKELEPKYLSGLTIFKRN
jgi:hypothetical protein